MKILVVPSGFKGTVLSKEVCQAISKGLRKAKTELIITEIPIADGGLGTAEILTRYFGGKLITCWVSGPLGKKVKARYGIVPSKKLAIIELAQAAGLHLVPPKLKNPLRNTTSGVGELIVDSLKRCCKKILLGVGDSATIDCGIGAMSACGIKFLDRNLKQVDLICLGLLNISKIDTTKVMKELRTVEFTILTDVANRLTGKNGAIV
jgi:glycerate kinase